MFSFKIPSIKAKTYSTPVWEKSFIFLPKFFFEKGTVVVLCFEFVETRKTEQRYQNGGWTQRIQFRPLGSEKIYTKETFLSILHNFHVGYW
jgi:hypothetical protein